METGDVENDMLFDTATGMKLQMLKMVKDLNTNQDRTTNARGILDSLNTD